MVQSDLLKDWKNFERDQKFLVQYLEYDSNVPGVQRFYRNVTGCNSFEKVFSTTYINPKKRANSSRQVLHLYSEISIFYVIQYIDFQKELLGRASKVMAKFLDLFFYEIHFLVKVKPPNSGYPKQRTCLEKRTKILVPNVTIFFKLPPNSGHLSITDKFFKTSRCPVFRGFTVICVVSFCPQYPQANPSSRYVICLLSGTTTSKTPSSSRNINKNFSASLFLESEPQLDKSKGFNN